MSVSILILSPLISCLKLISCFRGGASPDTNLTLQQQLTDEALDEVATWAAGVGPEKGLLVRWEEEATLRAAGEVGGSSSDLRRGRYVSSGLLERLHDRGLQVHPYTFQEERRFVLGGVDGIMNAAEELGLFLAMPGNHPVAPVRTFHLAHAGIERAGTSKTVDDSPLPSSDSLGNTGSGKAQALRRLHRDSGGEQMWLRALTSDSGQPTAVTSVDGIFADNPSMALAMIRAQGSRGRVLGFRERQWHCNMLQLDDNANG